MNYTLIFNLALGGLILILGFAGKVYARHNEGIVRPLWTRLAIGAGAVLALLAVTASYRLDVRTIVVGFPFPAAFWQMDGQGQWSDYVGPLTLPAIIGNAIAGFLFPWIVMAVAIQIKKRALMT